MNSSAGREAGICFFRHPSFFFTSLKRTRKYNKENNLLLIVRQISQNDLPLYDLNFSTNAM